MKSFSLSALVLLFVNLFACITAIPAASSAAVGSTNTNLAERALQPVTNQDILNLASDVFATQLAGTKGRLDQLTDLCVNFDDTRLAAQGYNVTAIHNIFCEAGWYTFLNGYHPPEDSYVQSTTIQFSSYLWIFQAVGALKNDPGRLKQLCESIDVPSSYSVGHNGTLVKTAICDAANGVALPEVNLLPVPFQDLRKSLDKHNGTVAGFVKALKAWKHGH